jgi:hypothetical protein
MSVVVLVIVVLGLGVPASALDEARIHINGIASVNASIFQIAE